MGTLALATALPRGCGQCTNMQIAVVTRVCGIQRAASVRRSYLSMCRIRTPPDEFRRKNREVWPFLGDSLGARGPAVLFELVLQDLSIEGAAADLEHARRLLLVPRHRLEHPLDLGALGVAQRGQLRPRLGGLRHR